jgi:hypothetical protein
LAGRKFVPSRQPTSFTVALFIAAVGRTLSRLPIIETPMS